MDLEDFSRSKRRVFDAAIDLFAIKTFETVTMEDIANILHRKKSSIYSHFASKQEILDTALHFFRAHFFDARLPIEAFNGLIETGSLVDILHGINFLFIPEHDLLLQKILRIVHQRKYHDPNAQALFQEVVIDRCIQYGTDVLDYVVAKGRVDPFDTRCLSTLLNYTRQGTYTRWVLEPTAENYARLVAVEDRILAGAVSRLRDRRPPCGGPGGAGR